MAKQYYKSIYFGDSTLPECKGKTVTLAFGKKDIKTYFKIMNKSSLEIKEIIGLDSYEEIYEAAKNEGRTITQMIKRLISINAPEVDAINGMTENDVTFVNSKQIPFQRWYPYIEGYSPDFIFSLVRDYNIKSGVLYEPFAGTGTTIFAADQLGINSVYSEVNPLLQFLIYAKLQVLNDTKENRINLSGKLADVSKNLKAILTCNRANRQLDKSYKAVFGESKYFPDDTYNSILRLRNYVDKLSNQDSLLASLVDIAICASLLPSSYLKKAGDVRFKTTKELEKGIPNLVDILSVKLQEISEDIIDFNYQLSTTPQFITSNAKDIGLADKLSINTVITSPPYLNGTNYFRNTKIELWYLKKLQLPIDLRGFRDQILTSGINDVKMSQSANEESILSKSSTLKQTMTQLKSRSYDKRIPIMAVSYFTEMYQIFKDLQKHLVNKSQLLIDLGDSIFCGVHIKTDAILIEILSTIGYQMTDFKVLRKRRSKNQEILSQVLIVLEYNKQHEQ